jgi:hypothetical protein
MSDEKMQEKNPAADKGRKTVTQMFKESVADGLKVMEKTDEVAGSNRQIVDAGFLGTCIVFFAAMLGLQQKQIDAPLTTALVAFAVAIPMLVYGFLYASNKAKPAPGWRLLLALQAGSVIVESLGQLAVGVGVLAVIAHLSSLAFKVVIFTSIAVALIGFSGSFVGLIIYALVQYKKQQKKLAPGETPVQSKETTEGTLGNS